MPVSETTARHYELHDPDVRLMLEVRDDNADAFATLMARYQDRLLRLFEHLVGKRDLAEDLAQEVFLRVYRARKRYVPGAKFSTWLFTIANNVASNALRSLARRKEVNVAGAGSVGMAANPLERMVQAASGLMPTRQADRAEMQQVVQLAVQSLGERQRMAVLLSKFEHLSYQEIGQIMELSTPAIKSLLSRARGNLRDALEPYLQHGQQPQGESNAAS